MAWKRIGRVFYSGVMSIRHFIEVGVSQFGDSGAVPEVLDEHVAEEGVKVFGIETLGLYSECTSLEEDLAFHVRERHFWISFDV